MKSENFISFFTVSGFFIALAFSLIKANNFIELILWVGGITLFFYLFIHLVFIFFYNFDPRISILFNKSDSEFFANKQIEQLKEKEKIINQIIKSIKQLKE